MKDKLINLLNNSYSPYSNFKVAAIAIMKDGKQFNGVNVENASFGATVCAERSAILNAISTGYKKGDFKELYVMCSGKQVSMCCMLCRQVILEFFDNDAKITCMNMDGVMETHTVSELCPYPFSEEDLK